MWTIADLLKNYFTHKDFLPPAEQLPGTLFTPLHIIVAILTTAITAVLVLLIGRKKESTIRRVFTVLWVVLIILEPTKIIWESVTGAEVRFEAGGILPLYPCSIFMYALPFAIWGKGNVRQAACGYICSLGLLGGLINFVYPVNVIGRYSCLSFSGFHTLFYHGSIVFCAFTMLLSGYHRYTGITRWRQLLLPSVPFLCVSVIANLVNFSKINSDYMFFKLQSFIFAPLGAALETWQCVIIVYCAYLFIHALPYLPSFIANKAKKNT